RAHVALCHYARHVVLRSGAQPDCETVGSKPFVGSRFQNETAAGSHNKTPVRGKKVGEASAFETAEPALAIEIEDHAQRQPARLLDESVKLKKRNFQPLRKQFSNTGFPRASQSDERNAIDPRASALARKMLEEYFSRFR